MSHILTNGLKNCNVTSTRFIVSNIYLNTILRLIIKSTDGHQRAKNNYNIARKSAVLSPAEDSIIFGVPVDQLIPNKTYWLFSHTIKAQESNIEGLVAISINAIDGRDHEIKKLQALKYFDMKELAYHNIANHMGPVFVDIPNKPIGTYKR